MPGTILLIVLILALVGSLPHSLTALDGAMGRAV
jgi:hypothetical protein